jgi:RNA polymerase sigma-70 factor (ECF subfamily)
MDGITGTWAGWCPPVPETLPVAQNEPEPLSAAQAAAEDDRALVASCLAGQRDAFEGIVARHQRTVYQLCYRFTGRHEDAVDLAQEVFLRAYRGLRNFKGSSSLRTWLYRIGINVCLNRAASRSPASEPLDDYRQLRDPGIDPAAALLRAERADRVRAAIAKLPPKQRATLVLRIYQDLPHQEIASILGGSVGAVKANFFHALQNLKKILRGETP